MEKTFKKKDVFHFYFRKKLKIISGYCSEEVFFIDKQISTIFENIFTLFRAKQLLKFGCQQMSGTDGSQVSSDCSKELQRLTELSETDENVEECKGLDEPLPWAHGTTFGSAQLVDG